MHANLLPNPRGVLFPLGAAQVGKLRQVGRHRLWAFAEGVISKVSLSRFGFQAGAGFWVVPSDLRDFKAAEVEPSSVCCWGIPLPHSCWKISHPAFPFCVAPSLSEDSLWESHVLMDKPVPAQLPCLWQVVTAEHQPSLPGAALPIYRIYYHIYCIYQHIYCIIQGLLLPGIAPDLGKGQDWMLASQKTPPGAAPPLSS